MEAAGQPCREAELERAADLYRSGVQLILKDPEEAAEVLSKVLLLLLLLLLLHATPGWWCCSCLAAGAQCRVVHRQCVREMRHTGLTYACAVPGAAHQLAWREVHRVRGDVLPVRPRAAGARAGQHGRAGQQQGGDGREAAGGGGGGGGRGFRRG